MAKEARVVNNQITDAVTQVSKRIFSDAPGMAISNLLQSSSHSLGLSFENAVNAQSQGFILHQTVTTQVILKELSTQNQ